MGGFAGESGLNAGHPSIATSPSGIPYVTWNEITTLSGVQIFVRRWNGNVWDDLGVGSASGEKPSIAIAPDGTPYLVWADSSSGDTEIYILRYNE